MAPARRRPSRRSAACSPRGRGRAPSLGGAARLPPPPPGGAVGKRPGYPAHMASQPEPPDRPERMAFERTGGSGTRLQVGIALVLGFVLAAILKPWDWGQPSVDTNPPGSAAAIAAARTSPSPKPTLDPRAVPCLTYSAWLAITIERTSGEEVHRWIVVDPVAAPAPPAPGVPSVRVVAGRLDGMGYCAPDGAAAAATPTVYRITDGTAEILNEATPLSLLVPTREHAALLFQPPPATDP